MYVSSTDNKDLFPDNAGFKFTIEFPKYLHLPEGEWIIALQEIRIIENLKRQDFYLNCSLCEPDPVYGRPVLRRVWVKGGKGYQTRYAISFYVPLISTDFKRFTILLEPINWHYTGIEVRCYELTIHLKNRRKVWYQFKHFM